MKPQTRLFYLEVRFAILYPADHNISSCHSALPAGDSKSDPSSCLGFHREINFFVCSANIPIQLHFLIFIQRRKERMPQLQISQGFSQTHRDQQNVSQCLHSVRSKRFREAKREETGFSAFCPRKKWGESKNKKEGVGEGKEGNACSQAL